MEKLINIKRIISENIRAEFMFSLIFLLCFFTACQNDNMTIIDEESNFTGQTSIVEVSDIEDESNDDGTKEAETKKQCVVVHVCGAVEAGGVYELEAGSRVIDAVQMAGGLTEDACEMAVNLSELLVDSQRIYIPTTEEAEGGSYISEYSAEKDDGMVNINTADAVQLTSLNGIGMTRAEAIVNYREKNGGFNEIEEIKNVSGIGDSSFEKIKEKIKVR